jgi:hypothetical protein
MASAAHPLPPEYVFPTLSEHISASFGSDSIDCAIQPRSDYGTDLAFSSAPPSVGWPHFEGCWSGSFEFRVENITGGLDGSYDLADPTTWSTFEISATVDDMLYGLKEGIGGGTGASGTLDYTGFPSMVGIGRFARLRDVTLVAADDPAQTITISEALLIAN